MEWKDYLTQAQSLITDAGKIMENKDATGEDHTRAEKMLADAKEFKKQAESLKEIKSLGAEIAAQEQKAQPVNQQPQAGPADFKTLPDFWNAVQKAGDIRYRGPLHPALAQRFVEYDAKTMKNEGFERKTALNEAIGAQGGFLVPEQFIAELYALPAPSDEIEQRASLIPMRSRSLKIPVLDQTGTTAGTPAYFGGVIAYWTEEAHAKTESEPTFRQIELVAHELVCYSRSSDALLEDSAIAIDAFLRGPLGFAGAIKWYREYAYLRGTGAGQPLGVINAPCTISVAAAANPGISVADLTGMLEHHYGANPVWHISKSLMSELLQLNGPTGNASYIFIPNARDGAPATLFGFPIIWSDKLPAPGSAGDIVLADWRYYLIGMRKDVTIDSTTAERFQYNQTSWRAVTRLDGQPWLSTYLTLSDGTDTVSPL